MRIEQLVREVQAALRISVDGKAGPGTWAGLRQRRERGTSPWA